MPPKAASNGVKRPGVGRESWNGGLSWRTLLWLVPIFTIWPYALSKWHYHLPAALPPLDASGRPQPSEPLILQHIAELERIGYRTVGTPHAKQGEEYVLSEVNKLADKCNAGGVLHCEVWLQEGSGFHEFSILNHDVLKVYSGVKNVIMRITARDSKRGKDDRDALLLGSHIDSTLPAPGAADDGIGVGVMLDLARVLVDRNEPFEHSLLFLWNGAEETFQDGSHLYSTQHETAKTVRAVINLEAAGSTGGALLFQATSIEMLKAYSVVPRPRGTVIAADVFASGIILSDTDFVQFEQYLNVSGLDMALVCHSYFYHTRSDQLVFISPGSAQHFADNVIAVIDELLPPLSDSPSRSPLGLSTDWHPPAMVYFSLYDAVFITWSMVSADKAYGLIAALVAVVTSRGVRWDRWKVVALTAFGAQMGMIVGLVTAFGLAGILTLLDKRLAWFRHEHLPLLFYAPAGFLGHLGTNHILSHYLSPSDRTFSASTHYFAQIVLSTLYMLLLQSLRIRSAYLFAVITCIQLSGLFIDAAIGRGKLRVLWMYAYPLTVLVWIGAEAATTTLDIFVPLTGRLGTEAPAEFIIATIAAGGAFVFLTPLTPLFHRLSLQGQRRVLLALLLFILAIVGTFAGPFWSTYDRMHPRRTAAQYTYNHTDSTHTMHMAYMDGGSTPSIFPAIAATYGTSPSELVQTTGQQHHDWDVLYPVSTFLETWKFSIAAPKEAAKGDWAEMLFRVEEVRAHQGETGIRRIKLHLDFTGVVLPTLTFTAEIVDWSFEFDPPHGRKEHHLKIASHVDSPFVEVELAIKADEGDKLSVHWSGIDLRQMIPGTALELGPDLPASKLLLEMDAWATETFKGMIDIAMYGAVCGVIDI